MRWNKSIEKNQEQKKTNRESTKWNKINPRIKIIFRSPEFEHWRITHPLHRYYIYRLISGVSIWYTFTTPGQDWHTHLHLVIEYTDPGYRVCQQLCTSTGKTTNYNLHTYNFMTIYFTPSSGAGSYLQGNIRRWFGHNRNSTSIRILASEYTFLSGGNLQVQNHLWT